MQSTVTMQEYYEALRKEQERLAARLDATAKTATTIRSRGSNLPNSLAAGDGWEAYKERVGL